MKLTALIEDSSEVEHRKELSEVEFLQLLKSKAKNSYLIAKQNPFFRQDHGPDLMLVSPEQKEERSSFWVDKMLRTIPAWNKLPSRSRFIKGFTKYDRTFGGDDVYVMIPLDGTRIGISPKYSFYRSFVDFEKSLGFDKVDNKTFLDWLNLVETGLSLITDIKIKETSSETYSQFKKSLEQIDSILNQVNRTILEKSLSSNQIISIDQAKVLKNLLSRHITNTESYLAEKLDPEANGFYSSRIESFSKGSGDHEVWADSKCLLIKRSVYIEMNKKGLL